MMHTKACTLVALLVCSAADSNPWPTPQPFAGDWYSGTGVPVRRQTSIPSCYFHAFDAVGNHRFRIDVTAAPLGALVQAAVPWRRRDPYTMSDTLVVAANSTSAVSKCYRNDTSLSSTQATFTFVADAGATSYYLYYLPFTTCEYAGGSCEYSADVRRL